MNKPSPVQLAVAGIVAVGVCVAIFLLSSSKTTSPSYAPLSIPGTDIKLWIELTATHPLLAEYDRTLVAARGDSEEKFALFPDTGGYGRLNIYAKGTAQVIVRGPFEDIVLNTGSLTMATLPEPDSTPGTYLAAFDKGSGGSWRFILASEAPELKIAAPQ